MLEKLTYEKLEQRIRELEKADFGHRKVEEALRESKELLERVMNGVSMLITYVDNEQRYVMVNQAYADWYGINREDLLGRRVADIVSPDVYARASPNIKKALSGQLVSYENKVIAKDGSIRYVSTNYAPHWSGTQVKGFLQP